MLPLSTAPGVCWRGAGPTRHSADLLTPIAIPLVLSRCHVMNVFGTETDVSSLVSHLGQQSWRNVGANFDLA